MSVVYKGRFAPTPSGPAHPGTLLTAVASYLQARAMQGQWHIRIDDIDPPRELPGAASSMLATLENYGLYWDGPVVYQSQRLDAYQDALQQLRQQGDVFECSCSRKKVSKSAEHGPNGMIYPGTCRQGFQSHHNPFSIRLKTSDEEITVVDSIQGRYQLNILHDVGDFVIRRADGTSSYHLATVVDDALDGFTEIVRGKDLLSITPQQILLQQKLQRPTPGYAHLPLLVDAQGNKFSKHTGTYHLNSIPVHKVLEVIFPALGLKADTDVLMAQNEQRWQWAVEHWNIRHVPATNTRVESPLF